MMTCNCNSCKGKCGCAKVAWVLVIIGGINWGLVGLGMLMGTEGGWNVVGMILGTGTVAAIVYLLVGIATLVSIFGCPCKKCKGMAPAAPASTPGQAM
jgi:uncharacterized membrane protein YuzA (DUF378 family)